MPSSITAPSAIVSLVLLIVHLVSAGTAKIFNHRLATGFFCLLLFPLFIIITILSNLLSFAINHMGTNPPSQPYQQQQQQQQQKQSTPTPPSRHPSSTSSPSTAMDDDSDASFQNNEDEMDYWLQRCSICFDAQLDLCLEYCRDQYCLDCFRRYLKTRETPTWSYHPTSIREH